MTFALTGNTLDSPIIFSSLQLFTVIKSPLQGLPNSITAVLDAMSAMRKPAIHPLLAADNILSRPDWIDDEGR